MFSDLIIPRNRYYGFFYCFIFILHSADINSNKKLKYYTTNSGDDFSYLIKQYNNYCLKKYDKSYQIEIVEFENNDEMFTKMSTELMAGEGPDIISLNQKLPFEKLIENGAFLDINTLINNDKTKDKIDLSEFNSVIMDVGVYNGKRYIVPLYYGTDVLVSTQERFERFGMSCNNGMPITYSEISNMFSTYFHNQCDYGFVSNDEKTLLWYDYPLQLFNRFINNYVDFENKVTYFNSNEFKDNLDSMYRMVKVSTEEKSNTLFDDLYINQSLPFITGNYAYYKSVDETPLICRGLVKNDNTYSAFVQLGFGINNNTNFKEQAYAFIKYALSDDAQMRLCGAKGDVYSSSLAFPVNKKAYQQLKVTASKKVDDDDKIIGINNDFICAYINIAEKLNECSLYMDVSHTYYNSSVIGNIVDKYLNDDISKDKFIRQLTAATKIYLKE